MDGIPEVWLVDLAGGVVEVCRALGMAGYATAERGGELGGLEVAGLPSVRVAAADVVAG